MVLAGGLGRRIGGEKAVVELRGTPLLLYPLRALQAVLAEVVVVAKRGSALPPLPGVPIWLEPDEPRHPLAGIVHALRGRALPAGIDGPGARDPRQRGDLPSSTRRSSSGSRAPTRAARPPSCRAPADGCSRCSRATARRRTRRSRPRCGTDPLPSLSDAVAALEPCVLELDDELPFFNVNAPEDCSRPPGCSIATARRGRSVGRAERVA